MSRSERQELLELLRPFNAFQEVIEARPILGLDRDEMYGIHGGRDVLGGASLSWRDVKKAAEMYRRLSSSPHSG